MRILISLCIACLLYVNLAVATHHPSHLDDMDDKNLLDCHGCNFEQQIFVNLDCNESIVLNIGSKLFKVQAELGLLHLNRLVNNKSPPSLIA